ncbi:hypothetical protein VNO80_15875 [Phaseolus coccineus]|uniref:Uncharacterized protein n=1 Tax=Phaseolus coccineus TaxID=3886 RepID=A0AAN9QZL6_PHACN
MRRSRGARVRRSRGARVRRSRGARVRRSRAAHGGTRYHMKYSNGSTRRDNPRARQRGAAVTNHSRCGAKTTHGAGLGDMTRHDWCGAKTRHDARQGGDDEPRQVQISSFLEHGEKASSTSASGDVDRCGGLKNGGTARDMSMEVDYVISSASKNMIVFGPNPCIQHCHHTCLRYMSVSEMHLKSEAVLGRHVRAS